MKYRKIDYMQGANLCQEPSITLNKRRIKMPNEKSPLIFEAIAKSMNDIEAIGKNKKNNMQNFNFRGIDDIYNALHPIFVKHKMFTIPEVLEDKQETRPSKGGGILTYRLLKIKYTCYASDGSNISGIVMGEAMDSGDKSTNKAMSTAHKYFLMQLFTIPTEDIADPDNETPEPEIDIQQYIDKINFSRTLEALKENYTIAYNLVTEDALRDKINKAKDARKEILINQQTKSGEKL